MKIIYESKSKSLQEEYDDQIKEIKKESEEQNNIYKTQLTQQIEFKKLMDKFEKSSNQLNTLIKQQNNEQKEEKKLAKRRIFFFVLKNTK